MLVVAGCDSSDPVSEVPSEKPTEDVEQTPPGEAIPGQYIVVLKDDAVQAKSKDAVRSLASQMLGKSNEILAAYETALTGFAATNVTREQVEALRDDDRVDYVKQDRKVQLDLPETDDTSSKSETASKAQSTPYGTTRVGGPVSGYGKTVWVLDTGIDLDHPDLNVNAYASRDFSGKGSPEDGNGHGTHVAGTIGALNNSIGSVGVAPGASVVGVKVLGDGGGGSYSGIINGINYVANNASAGDAANMSLGGGYYRPLNDAVANAASYGIYFAVAAGNSGANAANYSPASTNAYNVWTISAVDSADSFAYFSNYGNPPVDFAAPGVSVYSTYRYGGYATLSGTSMASPHAAAVLVLTGGNPSISGYASGDPDGNPDPIISL